MDYRQSEVARLLPQLRLRQVDFAELFSRVEDLSSMLARGHRTRLHERTLGSEISVKHLNPVDGRGWVVLRADDRAINPDVGRDVLAERLSGDRHRRSIEVALDGLEHGRDATGLVEVDAWRVGNCSRPRPS